VNDDDKSPDQVQQNEHARELTELLNLLEAVDRQLTPEHVARRFRELRGDTGDGGPPAHPAQEGDPDRSVAAIGAMEALPQTADHIAAGPTSRARPGDAVSMVLRPMGRADVPAVAAMEEAIFGAEAWPPELLATEVTADPASRYYIVADDDGVIIGYGGLLAQRGSQADVLTLAVAAHRWGEGIGGALLDGLLTEAARRGCSEVFLEVRIDNDRAQRLYRRHGFTDIGIRRPYYQPSSADALVMRRIIEPSHAAADKHPARRHGEETAAAPLALGLE
jgi:ribosomal-protein-alanine N-acetyltransferase